MFLCPRAPHLFFNSVCGLAKNISQVGFMKAGGERKPHLCDIDVQMTEQKNEHLQLWSEKKKIAHSVNELG